MGCDCIVVSANKKIYDYIMDADAWMAAHHVGSGVTANSPAWKEGQPLAALLDSYNNGLLCAPEA